MEEELSRMNPDMGAIEAYRKKDADYCTRVQELEAATAERDEVPLNPFPCPLCQSCVAVFCR